MPTQRSVYEPGASPQVEVVAAAGRAREQVGGDVLERDALDKNLLHRAGEEVGHVSSSNIGCHVITTATTAAAVPEQRKHTRVIYQINKGVI